MLIVALIASVCLYVGLYLLWAAAESHLPMSTALMTKFNELLLMPSETVFIIFRGLILITAFYLCADFVVSHFRRKNKNSQNDSGAGTSKSKKRDDDAGLKMVRFSEGGAASFSTPAIHESWLRRKPRR